MKHRNTIVAILLNILFCAAVLWFFTRNCMLRPYSGSFFKEAISGILLLGSLYLNYFLLYPKLYQRRLHAIYWLTLVLVVVITGLTELALAYPGIALCNAHVIEIVGSFAFFSKILFLIFGRNLFFNFFSFMMRERKQLQQSLETEVKIVYQYARMLDVCDEENNCQHIPIDDILYCKKYGNETEIHTVAGDKYTRYCTLKYLEQHLGNKEFIRVSSSVIVPFQHIASCDKEAVVMKTQPWMKEPLSFKLDAKRAPQIATTIEEHQHTTVDEQDNTLPEIEEETGKKNLSVPPEEKLNSVLNYILEHPGCRSTELISHTSFSQTTMDRCLFELKRRGLIEYTGSKKSGGYYPMA